MIDGGVTITALVVVGVVEVFKATIYFLWSKFLSKIFKKHFEKVDNKDQNQ
jgi:hypothetical protein